MNPDLIIGLSTAGCEAITEICKFLQTPEGQAMLKQSREDRVAFENNMKAAGDWFEKLFTGKLIPQP
jgi:hypothetical protein